MSAQTEATKKYKRFLRYEIGKEKKKYAWLVDVW